MRKFVTSVLAAFSRLSLRRLSLVPEGILFLIKYITKSHGILSIHLSVWLVLHEASALAVHMHVFGKDVSVCVYIMCMIVYLSVLKYYRRQA